MVANGARLLAARICCCSLQRHYELCTERYFRALLTMYCSLVYNIIININVLMYSSLIVDRPKTILSMVEII